jgi:hypothetical protein
VVSDRLTYFALLRCSVLALPLEGVGRQKPVLVAVLFGLAGLLQRDEEDHVLSFPDEAGLLPLR